MRIFHNLHIVPLVSFCVVSSLGLLTPQVAANTGNMSLDGHILCISVSVYLAVEVMGRRVCICAALMETTKSFSVVVVPIYTSTRYGRMSVSVAPRPFPCMCFYFHVFLFYLFCACDNFRLWF